MTTTTTAISDTDAARNTYLEQRVEPHIAKMFANYDWAKSIGLLVSQYYNDEAHDAVHGHLIISQHPLPRLEALWDWQHARDADELGELGDDSWIDPNIPADLVGRHSTQPDHWELATFDPETERYSPLPWDDNTAAIPLFAAYCDPGSDYESDERNQRPYALWVRDDNGTITRTIVGMKMRPWLDGVAPEEDY